MAAEASQRFGRWVRPAAADNGNARGEGKRRETRLSLFLRASVFDYLLVLVVATGLIFTVSYGFNSAPDLRGSWTMEAAIAALLLLILFAGAWSKKAILSSGLAYVVASGIVIAALSSLSPEQVPFFADGQVNDVAGNYAVFSLVVVVVPVIVYLLSRRPWGVAVLFFLTVLTCSVIQFLYRDWVSAQPGTTAALVVYLACAASYINQRYRRCVYAAKRVKTTSFGKAFSFSVLLSALCLCVGVAVFALVVSALGLTTPNIKPFQEYFQRPVVEYTGVYSEQRVLNPGLVTNQLNDNVETTRTNGEGGSTAGPDSDTGSNSPTSAVAQALSVLDINNWTEQLDTTNYDVSDRGLWLRILLPLLLVAGAVAARAGWRYLRLRRIATASNAEQVVWIYDFMLTRFAKIGIKKTETLTPLEFAMASSAQLEPFVDPKGKLDFLQLTLIYQRAGFGAGDISEEDVSRFRSYYLNFYKKARGQVGSVKWLFKFWTV